ncbi:hypothetical protein [Glycomyces sp. NPDC048151]|uniref:hypothetical protein n=1 Tax=Glycomyces sp. NPDC048151 TaxID=3364002 RepID=UPI00371A9541
MSSGFNLDPEAVDKVATDLFALSEDLHGSMKKVTDCAGALGGAVDTAEFTGVVEVLEAVSKWSDELIPEHRFELEEFAGYLVVAVRETVDLDGYVASAFDAYADEFPRTEGVPAPELPAPDPADAVPSLHGPDIAV